MSFNVPTLVTVALVSVGAVIAAPVLTKAFIRRGTGVKYEKNFIIQRAPQYASVLTIFGLVPAFLMYSDVIKADWAHPLITLGQGDLQASRLSFPGWVFWFLSAV